MINVRRYLLSLLAAGVIFGLGVVTGRAFVSFTSTQKIAMAQDALWDYLGEEYGGQWQKYFRDVPKWLGLPMLQMPFDVLYQQELIVQSQAEFVIETGTFKGGSALFFASVLDSLGGKGLVLTVDIKDIARAHPDAFSILKKYPLFERRVKFFHGSSTDPKIVAQIKSIVGESSAFVTLDSDHEGEHVYNELIAYSPLVKVGGYIVVQDTKVDDRMQKVRQQPYVAIRRFLSENPQFVIDQSRTPFLLTKYSDGVLRRVR